MVTKRKANAIFLICTLLAPWTLPLAYLLDIHA